MELPVEDLQLVHALQIAPRASWAELGSILGRHPATISARWTRLREDRMAWILGHLGGHPEQHCTAFVDVVADPARVDEARVDLCAISEVLTVDDATSSADFRLTCLAADWLTMAREVLPRIRGARGVQRTKVSLCTKLYATGNVWRLDVLSPAQQAQLQRLNQPPLAQPTIIPATFWPMLRVLMRDGRATASEIALATGQHPSTTGRALRTALETGMVTMRCELASHYTGYPLTVQWFARVPAGTADTVAAFLMEHRTLRLCASTTGAANMTFMMQLRTPADIADIEARLAAKVPGVDIIEACVGVHAFKRMGWMLDPEGRPTGEVVT
ncbi:AsnC family transcriptional regulator [Paeniglutamicibacter sp. ABSL32-1]|uniref:Lrp/AsnC family transcriptional regulator n=1 Tax=Paeniglutamicibacter quisquiliarum TaxID=2849498 RepID=UPI001C2CDF5B|nr:AsnC family transcriptional regulator [Paeniglutamicibacter quisquiliarum]MBV1780948.1 AsnC family transcriptional regulator [Paeniglutamicibacter quisquiliarum]